MSQIVIVDDNRAALKCASRVVREAGMNVTGLFTSGEMLLRHIKEGELPDLILLDVAMPGMNGLDTLKALRKYETSNNLPPVPVIFLTGEDADILELQALDLGASDYIKKPFVSAVFVQRIKKVLNESAKIESLSREAGTDALTGLLNKQGAKRQFNDALLKTPGAFVVLDIDSFKPVNDIYGHDKGDEILFSFAMMLKEGLRKSDKVGRIGGDEFIAFFVGIDDEGYIKDIISRLNTKLVTSARTILGGDMTIPLGVSAGAAFTNGTDGYQALFKKADSSLLEIKKTSKHSCKIWDGSDRLNIDRGVTSISRLDVSFKERSVSPKPSIMEREEFSRMYQYLFRYIVRYGVNSAKILFSMRPDQSSSDKTRIKANAIKSFEDILTSVLRNSDLICRCSEGVYYVLAPNTTSEESKKLEIRVNDSWKQNEFSKDYVINVDEELVLSGIESRRKRRGMK